MDESNGSLLPGSDHDALMNLWPRVGVMEQSVGRLERHQDRLEETVTGVREEIRAVEGRLLSRLDESLQETRSDMRARLAEIDTHLTRQDQQQADLWGAVAEARGRWPASAVVFITVVGTVVSGLVVMALAHLSLR